MSAPVIKVENLSKQYRIGERQGYKTFREAIVNLAKMPFRKSKGSNSQSVSHNLEPETIWALKDVSFEVKQGEVVGVIGRNGAGKSTLLKILSKITEPTRGRVELMGRVGSLLEVGTGFHPELTGHENIYLYGAILGMDRWEVTRKFDEIVAFAEIEKFIDTPVKRYSSGMYMRLAFAVAAHLEPEMLLIDEVLAVGDSKFQNKCLGKMESVAGEGRTVLFVSHNLGAIQGLCHRTLVLDKGILMFNGVTSNAIQHYTQNGVQPSEVRINLKDHAERSPKFEPVLHEVELFVNGKPSNTVGMCEKFEVAITISSSQAVRGIGLSFEDMFGRRLFLASTNYTNPDLLGDSTRCAKFVCNLPEIPFVPGTYYLTIIVAGFAIMLDKVERAASFNVVERDVFKTGVFPGIWKGLFYTQSGWRMENLD